MVERKRMPDTRDSVTTKITLSGHDLYVTVGLYKDGTPGEVFIKMAKQGSTVSGLMDTVGILISLALQYGVPLEKLCEKLRHTRFEPNEHGKATSIIDAVFGLLHENYCEEKKESKSDG